MRCLRKLVVGLGDFQPAQMGLSSQTLGKKKKTSPSFDSCFSKATQFEKLPPAISLRLFQRDHFGDCSGRVLVSRTAYWQEQAWHAFFSSLILFPPYSYIFANLILYTLFKNKVLRSVRISNQPAGALSDKQ